MATTDKLRVPEVNTVKQELALVNPDDIRLSPQRDQEIEALATKYVEELVGFSPTDFDTQESSKIAVEKLGEKLQRDAARKSQMLKTPIKDMYIKGEEGDEIGEGLLSLRNEVERLDPNTIDFSSPGWFSRMFGFFPFFGTPLKNYFAKYEQSQTIIDAIMNSLENGKQQLERDNKILAGDQKALRELTLRLEKTIKLGQVIDEKLEYKARSEYTVDDPKHKFINEELLFPLRQRIGDLQQQLLVSQQGIIAMELIIRNNKELIRGVHRAINVTVNALQVAVAVSMALTHQKMTLDKINAVNRTTSDLLSGTAARIKDQGVEIHKQASSSMLDMEALSSAFDDITMAMDDIAMYRSEALPRMKEAIFEFSELAARGEEMIQRLEQGDTTNPTLMLEIE